MGIARDDCGPTRRRPRRAGACLAIALAVAAAGCGREAPETVLLVTVDGVRPDRLDVDVAPRLVGLAAEGLSCERALTPIPHRRGALATVLTGLAPVRHQLRFDEHVLFDEHETLAERLRAEGWSTAAFVPMGALVGEAGLGQGFEVCEAFDEEGSDAMVARAGAWLADGGGGDRRFAWVHFDGPTAPYVPPGVDPDDGFSFFEVDAQGRPRHAGRERLHDHAKALVVFGRKALSEAERERALALKTAEVSAFDARLGRLLDAAGEEALVVVTGTHGESLGEHGYWFDHGEQVFDASLRVPLVLAGPGIPAAGIETPVGLADVTPTLLERLGAGTLPAATGRSFAAAARGEALEGRPLFAESGPPLVSDANRRLVRLPTGGIPPRQKRRVVLDPSHRLRAVSMPSGRKFVLDPIDGELRAFDVQADPGETTDRSNDPAWSEDVERARALLEAIVRLDRARVTVAQGKAPPPAPELDRTVALQLVEAGYLE